MVVHLRVLLLLLLVRLLVCAPRSARAANFPNDFDITWGGATNVRLFDNNQLMELVLDEKNASGIASKNKFLFGRIGMQMKLVPGNSAGTVTTYYLSSETSNHDELDFEFLGNVTGQPYILQTNVFANGVGGREQRLHLWCDPSADYHTYSVLWNQQHIIFFVDDIPIRQFVNNEALGLPYLKSQPMRIFSSIWNGDSWATRGGLVKIDWTAAPFIASYTCYTLDACVDGLDHLATCPMGKWWSQTTYQTLGSQQNSQLSWVLQNYMVYNYCRDTTRYSVPPLECSS